MINNNVFYSLVQGYKVGIQVLSNKICENKADNINLNHCRVYSDFFNYLFQCISKHIKLHFIVFKRKKMEYMQEIHNPHLLWIVQCLISH